MNIFVKEEKLSKNKWYCLQIDLSKIKSFDNLLIIKIFTNEHPFLLNLTLLGDIFHFTISFSRKRDHAGFNFELELLGLSFLFYTYDHRHWDDENDDWVKY